MSTYKININFWAKPNKEYINMTKEECLALIDEDFDSDVISITIFKEIK